MTNNTMQNEIVIPVIQIKQPIGSFYVGSIDWEKLVYISEVDVRRLESSDGQREVETYIGIQRPLSPSRVKELGSYVNLVDATFPTSILLHIEPEDVHFEQSKDNNKLGTLKIAFRNNVAKVLDGQHRIEGLRVCKYTPGDFELNVTIFVGMDIEDQAITFATINKTQTKVNKSLVADLYAFAKTRSPQKTGHVIVRALDQKKDGPFYEKIKILGTAEDKEKETITQATFVENIIKYISGNKTRAMEDRDLYRRGLYPPQASDTDSKKLIFRKIFINEEDEKIAKIINNYFSAVRDKWPNAWNQVRPNMILNKSTGFVALMKFLKIAYISMNKSDQVIEASDFRTIFNKIDLAESDFTADNYLPGQSGQSKLYQELVQKSGLKEE